MTMTNGEIQLQSMQLHLHLPIIPPDHDFIVKRGQFLTFVDVEKLIIMFSRRNIKIMFANVAIYCRKSKISDLCTNVKFKKSKIAVINVLKLPNQKYYSIKMTKCSWQSWQRTQI